MQKDENTSELGEGSSKADIESHNKQFAGVLLERLESLHGAETCMVCTSSNVIALEDVHDDLQRELAFYNNTLDSARKMLTKLEDDGIQWRRPADFVCEMVKSDEHMAKIKTALEKEEQRLEDIEKAKRARQLKKEAKVVQRQRETEKIRKKKETLEAIKTWRKDREQKGEAAEPPPFLEGDGTGKKALGKHSRGRRAAEGDTEAEGGGPGKKARAGVGKSKKRQYKDAKYGFGGRKQNRKENDLSSVADVSGFKPRKMKTEAKALAAGHRVGKAARGGRRGGRMGSR